MIMNKSDVHSPNKALGSKQGQQLAVSLLVSVLLTACGGGGGLSAEQKAAEDAAAAQAAAQAAAAQAAATAAAQAAAAQAAAEKQAALLQARETISADAKVVDEEVSTAKSASSIAGYWALQSETQAASYQEVSQLLAQTKEYAAQSAQAAENASTQKTVITQLMAEAENLQSVEQAQQLVQKAKAALQLATDARKEAEQAKESTRTAAQKVADAVKVAEAARRYTKLDSAGNELPATADAWACVKDKNTGLVWEMKTDDGGVRDKDWRYRHLHNSGGYASTVDYNGKTLCKGLGSCDPYSYINVVQSQGLCGRTSWRLPVKSEMGTIAKINAGGQAPHIDQAFFPDVVNKPYEAAYCTENMITNPSDCGYAPGSAVHYNADGRIECNYQGVDYGLPLLNGIQTQANLELSILVPLRYYGEVKDGKPLWPNANWVCYTRLVSSR